VKRETLIAYLCLTGICIIWGTTYLVMRIGVLQFPPFLFAAIRQIVAGVLLSGFLILIKGVRFPNWNVIGIQAFRGFLMITLGNGLVSWAEVFVSSGLAAIICSTLPVLVILINISINRSELPNWIIVSGVLIGLAGILLVFSEYLPDFANPNYRTGIFLIFVAIIAWAIGSVLIQRRNYNTNPFLNTGMQMLLGGIFCLPFSYFFDDYSHVTLSNQVTFALLYLILVGSIAAFSMYTYVLTNLPMTIASLYSYINPLVAVILGWLILDEKLNPKIGVAIIITVVGIYFVNLGYRILKKKIYREVKI
jgi:drug/metabolite transporter (DMT)-like permease